MQKIFSIIFDQNENCKITWKIRCISLKNLIAKSSIQIYCKIVECTLKNIYILYVSVTADSN